MEVKQQVQLQLFDITAEKQVAIFNKVISEGKHTINQNIDNIPSGIYICRLTGKQFISQKLVIIQK